MICISEKGKKKIQCFENIQSHNKAVWSLSQGTEQSDKNGCCKTCKYIGGEICVQITQNHKKKNIQNLLFFKWDHLNKWTVVGEAVF